MANSNNITPFITKWEGGLSRNPADSASANPAPWPYKGVTGWHTNKGVTYSTFVSLAPLLKYQATPDNFFIMPNEIWNKIFKRGYWDSWHLDKLNSQSIADLIADFAWGSGIAGSFNSIKKYLATKGYSVKNTFEAVEALNKITVINGKEIFLELVKWRENFFKGLNQPAFTTGWLNRLNDLKNLGLQTIQKKKLDQS